MTTRKVYGAGMADEQEDPPTCPMPGCGATMRQSWTDVPIMGGGLPQRVEGPWECPRDPRHPKVRPRD